MIQTTGLATIRRKTVRLVRKHPVKSGLLRRVLDEKRQRDRNHGGEAGRHPKKPSPVQGRDVAQAEKRETREHGRSESEQQEPAQVDHAPKDPGERPPLGLAEPGGVYLDESGGAEGLHVAVNAPDSHEYPQQAPE